jgi:hypothetical protein
MLPKRSFLALIVLVALAVLLSLVGCRPFYPHASRRGDTSPTEGERGRLCPPHLLPGY